MNNLNRQIEKWLRILNKIHISLVANSPKSKGYDRNNIVQFIAYTIKHSQFFTFDSIITLIKQGQYFDSFSLLRTLFEGHITLWRICNNDIDIANEFIDRATKVRYNISAEINKMFKELYNDYYDNECLTPIDIKGGYWEKPLSEIIKKIDDTEENSWPYHGLMYSRLYSAGSEFIHRSSYAIDQGFITMESPNGKRQIIHNPNLGIESAWWASIIIIDSEKWYGRLLGDRFEQKFVDLKKKAMNLASEWTKTKQF